MEINITTSELSELIGEIYDATLTSNWDVVLDKIIDATQSNKAFFFLQELGTVKPLILEIKTTFEFPQQVLLDYQSRPLDDPFYQVTKLVSEGESIYCNEFINMEEHVQSEYYKSIFVPMRSYFALAGVLCRDGVHESAYSISRGSDQKPYDAEDINLFKLITPHLSRAMHIFKELRLYKSYSNISKSILDQDNKAIIVCDQNGRVIISNEFANNNLTKNCQVFLGSNQLELQDKEDQKKLDYYIEQCALLAYKDIGIQETLIIEGSNSEDENILITVAPLINKNTFNDIDIPCCLITVNFQHQLNWLKLQNEFKLTPRELQLLKAIYAKKKLNELTSVFNVSYNTLRTHLQAIFKKVQVNSQTELMIKINLFN